MSEHSFEQTESRAGLVMLAAAAVALVLANSPWGALYESGLALVFEVRLGDWSLGKPILLWINDGLMAVFFLLVGLEIKREVLDGELSTPAKFTLPVAAAIGGMVVPALLYVAVNRGDAVACAAGRSRPRPTLPSRSRRSRCSVAASRPHSGCFSRPLRSSMTSARS